MFANIKDSSFWKGLILMFGSLTICISPEYMDQVIPTVFALIGGIDVLRFEMK